jgi:hypothetical protein
MYQKHGRNIRIQGIIIGIESAQLEAPFHFFAPFSERHDNIESGDPLIHPDVLCY